MPRWVDLDNPKIIKDGRDKFGNVLYGIPPDTKTADVRPVVRGRWVPVTNGRGGHECSKCHQYAPSYQSGSEYLSRFCPACGCYMGEC